MEQVRERLLAEVDPEGLIVGGFWDRRTDRDRDFVGQIRETSFTLRRRRRFLGPHRGANPRAWGSLTPLSGGGTLITASFPRDVWQRIVAIPVVLLALAVIAFERDLAYRAAEIVLLIAIVLVVLIPGGLGKRQIREFLEEVAAPATPSEPWRPYAGRDRAE